MKIKAIQREDEIILKGIADADPVQVNRLYDELLPGILRHVKTNSGTEAEAYDVFQDAVMAVYKKLKQQDFELQVPFSAWFFAICRNIWLSKLRSRRMRPVVELKSESADPDPGPEASMEILEREKLFYRHFSLLGGNCRQILQMFFQKIPLKQIAETLGTTESYIKKRKHHCKEKLIKAVQDDPLFKSLKNDRSK